MDDDRSELEERLLSLLGISLDDTPPRGEPPTDDEIDRWRRGMLDEQRAAEVLSHLARDPAAFAMLAELRTAERELAGIEQDMAGEKLHAALAIALDAGVTPDGASPTLEEVDLWRRRALPWSRADEVLTHLARDPGAFAMLTELRSADRELAAIEHDLAREQAAIAVGLALDDSVPIGATPDLAELDRWRHDLLEESRAAEVRSHVLLDPAIHAQLRELELAERELAQIEAELAAGRSDVAVGEQAGSSSVRRSIGLLDRLRAWFAGGRGAYVGGGFAAVVAAVFVAVIGLRVTLPPSLEEVIDAEFAEWPAGQVPSAKAWPWISSGQAKSPGFWKDPVGPGDDVLAFGSGLRRGLQSLVGSQAEWQPVIEQLPDAAGSCPTGSGGEPCTERQRFLAEVGRWSALVQLRCEQTGDAGFWEQSLELVDRFREEAEALADPPKALTDHLRHWPVGADARDSTCSGVLVLVDIGLGKA